MPILTAVMGPGEGARSRQLHHLLVLSCTVGAMEVMENVPDGQGYEAWRRPLHAYGNPYSAETLFRKATVLILVGIRVMLVLCRVLPDAKRFSST